MSDVLHPRPSPIIAAMYTLRDLDADVIVMHGPPGCGFTASRLLEEAGVTVITTGMQENDLIFGAENRLVEVLKRVDLEFSPRIVGVVGTCASMIIGENLEAAIKKAGIRSIVLPIDIHACSGPNTVGAIKVLEVAMSKGIIPREEFERQKEMLMRATALERERGMTSKPYLKPHRGVTKLKVARMILDALSQSKNVAVVLNAKKETAYRFADVMRAVEYARRRIGGSAVYVANVDPNIGLPRIRRYSADILRDLKDEGITIDFFSGGLDEYPVAGEKAAKYLEDKSIDLRIICGLPHAIPDLKKEDILVTDQPRELRNFIDSGFAYAVGEISTHSMLMGARGIVHSELGDTIRELVDGI
ncbi:MAG: Ni-sirohydrochlorin a,c-diamide reductive cyclase catalytic subunit, partial [Methanomassiliicoccales archaeon]